MNANKGEDILVSLKKAEGAVWSFLKDTSVADSAEYDYSKAHECLRMAEQIGALYKDAARMLASFSNNSTSKSSPSKLDQTTEPRKINKMHTPLLSKEGSKRQAKDPSSTFYFVFGDKLFKLASKEGNSKYLYKKTVQLSDVEKVLFAIRTLLTSKGYVTVSEISRFFNNEMPNYKIHIPIGALVSIGALQQLERGRYVLSGGQECSVEHWIDELNGLEKRRDLLESVR